ncbi:MAG: TM2 domain-containing protein [Muribaculaceae bacterium]|nr:TM2 domain-containing protein [Muribaculaceae bacterium]
MESLICPHCKGNKYTMIAKNTFMCAYCGSTFQGPKTEPEPQVVAPPQYAYMPPQPIIYQQIITPVQQQRVRLHNRNKTTAAILSFPFGILGMQFFYLGKKSKGIWCCLFFWTLVPAVVGLIQMIIFATMSDKKFDDKYNYR